MAAPVIQFKRGLFSNLPGLRIGEPGFTTDKYDLYVGIDSTTNGNKFFGSHRYWTKETTTTGSGVNLVEGTNNGENAITLKAPASLGSSYTVTFPSAIVNNGYLKVASDGTLTWDNTLDSESIAITGIGTIPFLQATTVNASGIVTASSFSGSGSGLTSGTVPISSLDIDGGTAATSVTSGDLFIIDDGANGTNKKVTAQLLSDFVLGGSGGATFPSINVTGIATVNQFNAADAKITGIATASQFRASNFRDVDGSLVPLVGVSSLTGHTGLVTAFKFTGTGLEEYVIANEIATIKISGVAASTYTTSEVVTASTNQTTFTFTAGYEDGFIDAYLNGIRLIPGVDFTANDATTVVLSSQATAGDELEMVATKSIGNIYSLNQLKVGNSLTVAGVVTAGSFNGALNFTGVSTAGQVQATTVNASGIVTASSFSGSGAGLSAGTTPISTLDIDGATAATALTSDDLFIIDDGAGGTNKKLTAQQLSNYVLGGSGGATFPAINVTGIGTVSQLKATTATVGAGLTVTGATDLNGGLDVSGGETVLSSATVSDLTSGRVVLAGTSGALQDSANLTFGDNGLRVTGSANVSGIVTASSFSGPLTGNVTGNINSSGISTSAFLQATTVNASGIVTALSFSGSGAGLSAGTTPISTLDIDGATAATTVTSDDLLIIDDGAGGTNKKVTAQVLSNYILGGSGGATFPAINVTGIATATFVKATTATVGAGLTVTGATDLNGGLDVSGGETVLSSATVSDLTSGRVVLAGASGALQDSANLTFGDNGLTVTGGSIVSAASTFSSDLAVGGNVIVSGDLTVNGTTTQINTVQMTVEDTLIELQIINGSAPGSDTNKDVGMVMNYFDGSAKKAAFYWDDSAGRMVAASAVSESSGVLTASTFAGLEVGSLYLNDCAGASQVISCSGTTRSLENITIDGGSF
jgi:hypothetical protein